MPTSGWLDACNNHTFTSLVALCRTAELTIQESIVQSVVQKIATAFGGLATPPGTCSVLLSMRIPMSPIPHLQMDTRDEECPPSLLLAFFGQCLEVEHFSDRHSPPGQ